MRRILVEVAIALIWICAPAYGADKAEIVTIAKPTPDEALEHLKSGNQRFFAMKAAHPHSDASRLRQAGLESQSLHAYATILTCSDSRLPVELIFDAGVMDLFVIRIAGNVCNSDQAGSIEYGLAHVKTPVLVVMGHSQCGAVTAVAQALQGKGHALERNIPGMIASIQPAVKRVMQGEEGANGPNLIDKAIEENVWQAIENLFLCSPRTRELVNADKVKVVGAVYDVGTGRVKWLPDSKVYRVLGRAEANPGRALEAMAGDPHGDSHDDKGDPKAAHKTVAAAAQTKEDAHGHSHGDDPHAKPAAKADPHAKTDTHAKGDAHDDKAGHAKVAKADAKNDHGDAKDSHGTAKKDDKKKSDAHADDGHGKKDAHGKEAAAADGHGEDAHGEEKKAEGADAAAPAKSKPWMLIGIAGGVAILGAVLLLLGMKKPKDAGHGPAADAGHAPAH